jgi:microcystin-dependent protein
MTEQRLPIVNSDDGAWGDILNQYLSKEHYNTGINNTANGGHQMVTLRPGTTTAGTAPIKFTSGSLLATPESGTIEYSSGTFYIRGTDKLSVGSSISASTLASTIAVGTAPLTVTSTTAVTNLNADMVDGIQATGFATAAQGTLATYALPTASYTAADVLAKIETVDGAGSGLDADTLDGKHASDLSFSISNYNVGDVVAFSGDNSKIPSNGLLADGRAISRTDYPDYFTLVGTTYGAGDGSTTFNIPNIQHKVITMQDTTDANFTTLGQVGGADTVTLDSTMVPNHNHTASSVSAGAHSHGSATGGMSANNPHSHTTYNVGNANPPTNSNIILYTGSNYGQGNIATNTTDISHTHSISSDGAHTHTITVAATTGGGSSHNNLQPYIVLNYYVVVTKNVTDPGITGNADTVDNCNVNDSAAPSSLVLWTSQKEVSYFATADEGTLAANALPASSYTASDVLTKVKSVDGSGS